MAQHGQEHLPRPVRPLRVAVDRLSQRLVNRLVKPRQVDKVTQVRIGHALAPQPQHTRPQRPVLRHHRLQVKPRCHPLHRVPDRRPGHLQVRRPRVALTLGLAALLQTGLRRLHVRRGRQQELLCMVAQRGRRHLRAGQKPPRKALPLHEDRLGVRQNKISQPHDVRPVFPGVGGARYLRRRTTRTTQTPVSLESPPRHRNRTVYRKSPPPYSPRRARQTRRHPPCSGSGRIDPASRPPAASPQSASTPPSTLRLEDSPHPTRSLLRSASSLLRLAPTPKGPAVPPRHPPRGSDL